MSTKTITSAWGNWGNNKDTWSAVASIGGSLANTFIQSQGNYKANKSSAASLRKQMSMFSDLGGMQMRAAGAYSAGARASVETGKANAKNERIRAGQVYQFEQLQLSAARQQRAQKVGQGKAAFAANGILLEDREGAAVAKWEQDEAADFAVEQLAIMESAENQVWGFLMNANQQVAQGYNQAASYSAQAASAAGQDYSSYSQAIESRNMAREAERAAKKSKFGGVLGGALTIGGAAIGGAFGGPIGVAIGGSLGGSLGGMTTAAM